MSTTFRLSAIATVAVAVVLGGPRMALAHAIGGRSDLPVPLEYFIVGSGLVLVVSFVALAVLWPRPRLQDGPDYGSTPKLLLGWLRPALGFVGILFLLLVIGQIVPEVLGLETVTGRPTIAPVTVWVAFWLVVPFASAVIGDWYTDLNPWRSIGRYVGAEERPAALERWGVWPATVLFVAFTWLELVSPSSGEPVVIGFAALGYTILLIAAMAYAGRSTGLQSADAFTTYNRLISAISPIGRTGSGRLVWRGWLRSLPVIPEWPGLWVFVIATIGTVSFDGASGTAWFSAMTGPLGDGVGGQTVLLVGSVVVIALAYLGACAVAASLSGEGWSAGRVAQRFAHTLVPIALAYAFAHYFTLVLFEGQLMFSAISDPFGLGWDLFGTADRRVEFFITSTDLVWYIQVASIVMGHVLGVVLAHDRALEDFGRDAVRSQYAMLALMVGFTTLGLLILAG
jgi:hypothetical protein